MVKSLNYKTIGKSFLATGIGILLLAQVQLYAAKGEAKAKKGYVLKFSGFDLKGVANSFFTFKPDMVYKGSFNNVDKAQQQNTLQTIVTYQKGNTTFIYPYKHKPIMPKFKTPEAPKFWFVLYWE